MTANHGWCDRSNRWTHMIDEKTKSIVLEALSDEYQARAFYRPVIKTCGPVRPFIHS